MDYRDTAKRENSWKAIGIALGEYDFLTELYNLRLDPGRLSGCPAFVARSLPSAKLSLRMHARVHAQLHTSGRSHSKLASRQSAIKGSFWVTPEAGLPIDFPAVRKEKFGLFCMPNQGRPSHTSAINLHHLGFFGREIEISVTRRLLSNEPRSDCGLLS